MGIVSDFTNAKRMDEYPIREKLVYRLAVKMRAAETHYINSDYTDDSQKWAVEKEMGKFNLNPAERRLWEQITTSWGV